MKPRYCPPLNGLQPRTLRDVRRDPFDYVEVHRRPLHERVADVIFATVLGICGALLLVHFLAR